MCKYFYKKENGKKYLFVEWKNGDYICKYNAWILCV